MRRVASVLVRATLITSTRTVEIGCCPRVVQQKTQTNASPTAFETECLWSVSKHNPKICLVAQSLGFGSMSMPSSTPQIRPLRPTFFHSYTLCGACWPSSHHPPLFRSIMLRKIWRPASASDLVQELDISDILATGRNPGQQTAPARFLSLVAPGSTGVPSTSLASPSGLTHLYVCQGFRLSLWKSPCALSQPSVMLHHTSLFVGAGGHIQA
jgi:hypothetical protein